MGLNCVISSYKPTQSCAQSRCSFCTRLKRKCCFSTSDLAHKITHWLLHFLHPSLESPNCACLDAQETKEHQCSSSQTQLGVFQVEDCHRASEHTLQNSRTSHINNELTSSSRQIKQIGCHDMILKQLSSSSTISKRCFHYYHLEHLKQT